MRHVIAAILFAAVTSSCSDLSISLSKDAQLVQMDGATWAIISEEGDFLVYPNVTALTCRGEIAFGVRELANGNTDYSEPLRSGLGYFLLSTESGALLEGLNREELINALANNNIEFQEPHRIESFERSRNGCS